MAGINDVVNAVQTILQGVANMGTVYTYTPLEPIDPSQYPYAIIMDHRQSEDREGTPYRTGKKWITHTVSIDIHDITETPDVDQANFHDFLDSIRTALRDDPSLSGITLRAWEHIDVDWTIQSSGSVVQYDATITSDALEEISG